MDRLFIEKIQTTLEGFPEIIFGNVFGSYASGKPTVNSDVDLSVAAYNKLSFTMLQELRQRLNDCLDRDIDLVDLNAVSGLILKEALTTGKVIINKDPELYSALMKKMLYNQADMMPYYNRILKERREEFING